MKFQDLKLEKERERGIQEAKTTTYWVERERERENLWHGGSMGAVLREEYDLRYWFCENEMEKTRSKILMWVRNWDLKIRKNSGVELI